ncbi:protein ACCUMULATION AND REPLICATION OF CHLOROPLASTS 3, chloroplastic-like [Rutidosis leptorrhynchoides]|uniref:protein ACCUMULATION AND REPLICATION OF CHLOROPLASTS 3, chloroplastic-like n=1 Tax=Rutidosis leptorrhynchoides TaxID=125765 RepID=UPI003A99AD63
MAISMELAVLTNFTSLSSKQIFHDYCFFRPPKLLFGRLHCNTKRLAQVRMVSEENNSSSSSLESNRDSNDGDELWREDSELVEVICIGSRKDSVLEFCLDSPLQSSSSLRFWNIVTKEPGNVQLHQRTLGNDNMPKIVDASSYLQSSPNPKAIILVASAGYGLDHVTAIDMLKTMKSRNGLAVAIILKPFSFEGKRRQDEVKHLIGSWLPFADIQTDALLKKDLVTLTEALRTANAAFLLAINSISVLISESQRRFLDAPLSSLKELHASEAIKILDSYKEAKVGFGAGYNIKSSILQAVFDCPFIGTGLKDLNGTVMCTIASSAVICNSDLHSFLQTLRETTGYTKDLIISTIHEPNLEPNRLVTTIIIMSCAEQKSSPKSTIYSRLAKHAPFVFNLLKGNRQPNAESKEDVPGSALASEGSSLIESGDAANEVVEESSSIVLGNYLEEVPPELSSNDGNVNASWSSNSYDQLSTGTPAFQRDSGIGWNLGPAYQIAQDWAKERTVNTRGTSMHNNLSIFCLPVGVRPSEDLKDDVNGSYNEEHDDSKPEDDTKDRSLNKLSILSLGRFTDVGVEAIKGFRDTASNLTRKKPNDVPKKQGVLSARAASMLEAERDTFNKKWNPVVEMQYRGGVYKGRCQGGLPEGKGCLTLGDGSIYDGTWHSGTRSGVGTFYFSNGDVFQGSWRDDVIHGKGWYYFHTGDRWFANFWKGKANGEGRFYSKLGDVFFGHFQDGWRHGRFLCIDVDGARFVEVWDEGVLISRKEQDSDTTS